MARVRKQNTNTNRASKKRTTKKESNVKKSKKQSKATKAAIKQIVVKHTIKQAESESFREAMKELNEKSFAEINARDGFHLSLLLINDAKTTNWKQLFSFYNDVKHPKMKKACVFSDSSARPDEEKGLQMRNAMYEAQHKAKFPNRPLHLNYAGTEVRHADGPRCLLREFGLDAKYVNVLRSKLGQDCKKKFFPGLKKAAKKSTTKK